MGSTAKTIATIGISIINPLAGVAIASYNAYQSYTGYKDMKHQAGQAGLLADQRTQENLRYIDQQTRAAQHSAHIQAGAAMHAAHAYGRAAGETREIAGMNASLTRQEGAETVRREKRMHRQVEGTTKALQWASGVRADTGSTQTYFKEMKSEHGKVRAWISKAFSSRANIIMAQGESAAGMLEAQAHGAAEQARAIAAQVPGIIAQGKYAANNALAQLADYKRELSANLSAARHQYQSDFVKVGMSLLPFALKGVGPVGSTTSGAGGAAGTWGGVPFKVSAGQIPAAATASSFKFNFSGMTSSARNLSNAGSFGAGGAQLSNLSRNSGIQRSMTPTRSW